MSGVTETAFSIATEKAVARVEAFRRRAELDAKTRIEAAKRLCKHAADLPLPPGSTVAGYWSIRDEIDPRPLLDGLRQNGHILCLPVVNGETLTFREFVRGAPLVPAGFGTFGPDDTARTIRPNVVLLPLAGFDRYGVRLGWGKGHYDRALATLHDREHGAQSSVLFVGLGFAVQEFEQLPRAPHDVLLDWVLTEVEAIAINAP